MSNNRDINVSKLGVNYAILLENEPDFTWVPHLRPRKNLVMGDHVFCSPVIVYKKGKYALAFIPDLKRVSGYIMFDWGIGSAATATAYVKKYFGDLFIDFKERLTFGIDGVLIKSFEFKEKEVYIELNLIQGKDYILIKCRDSPLLGSQIIINSFNLAKKEKIELDNGFKYEIII